MNRDLRDDLVSADGPLEGCKITDVSSVGGGCIHQAWQLKLSDGRQLFAKTGSADAFDLFEVEAEALTALGQFGDSDVLVVPQPLSLVLLPHGAVLLLPWLPLGGGNQQLLGRGLALLHQASREQNPQSFGWHRDGYIGAGPQPGGWRMRWGDAFADLRLRPQLERCNQFGMSPGEVEGFLENVAGRLNQREVTPTLVHGDLWAGNANSLMDGRGSIYDPASWWADAEVDLAMTRLFGGFGELFYRSYDAVVPQIPGAQERFEIYNLYHLLNHANLFGGGYIDQSRACLRGLARQMAG
jgi:fructosamine-3-kinase